MTLVRRWPATIATVVACALVIALEWRGRDYPAQMLRIAVFRQGDWFWNPQWFGGHPTLGYSLLAPALGALVGATLLGLLVTTGAVAAFEHLVRHQRRAALATAAFAFGMVSNLVVGRLTFGLGFALGVAAVAALPRSHVLAGVFAFLTALSSPVAAVFLAIAFAAWGYARRERIVGAALVVAALAPAGTMSILFGTGGDQPFPSTVLAWALGLCATVAVASDDRMIRAGCALYGAVCLAAFVVDSPFGSNVGRMPLFLAAPLLILADPGRVRRLLVAAVPIVAGWQGVQIAEVADASAADRSTSRGYYESVVTFLEAQPDPVRVEIPSTKQHWETAFVAARVPIARGWERQIDRGVNPEFYDEQTPLDATIYHGWLARNGVTHVALPDTDFDASSVREAELVREGLDYLTPVFRDEHWTVYVVVDSPGLLIGPGRIADMENRRVALQADQAGRFVVRVRSSPYWNVIEGQACFKAASRGWIVLDVAAPGRVVVEQQVELLDALDREPEPACTSLDGSG